jgi:hypothetical protein
VAAADDKLVADAAEALAASATPEAGDAPEVVIPSEPVPEPAPQPKAVPVTDESDNDNVSITGKKVIQPIDSSPKKDIDVLLAEEEAKNQQGSIAAAPPVIVTNETGTQKAEEPKLQPASGTVAPTAEASNPVNTVSGPVMPTGTPAGTPGASFDPNQIAL